MEIIKSIGFSIVLFIFAYSAYLLAIIGLIFLIKGLYLKVNKENSKKAFNTSSNFFTIAVLTFMFLPAAIITILYISARFWPIN